MTGEYVVADALPEPYYTDESVTLYHADCRSILHLIEPANLILADPPYGIPKGSAIVRQNTEVVADWGDERWNVYVEDWLDKAVTTDNAYLVEFINAHFESEDRARALHTENGWRPWRRYLLVKSAPPPTPRKTFVTAWEESIVSVKGERLWWGTGYTPDRWIGLTPNRRGTGDHPSQKPLDAMSALVRALCPVGGLVLDPFAGSGTTLRAAKDEGRRAIGIEGEEKHCETVAKRLGQDTLFVGLG